MKIQTRKLKSKLPTFPDGQRVHGGGKFHSKQQRQFMWAVFPRAAKKWADNRKTRKDDWHSLKPRRHSKTLTK